jgi:hypothetical protein
MFCAPELIFGGTVGVESRFHVLRARTHFRRYRGHLVPFSASELVFGVTDGVGSRFHVLCSRTCFWRCGGCRLLFSCFTLPDSFSTLPRTSGPIFLCCAPVLVLGGTEGVRSRFYVLRSLTHFRCYRGRRLPFSCFTLRTRFPWYRGRRVPFSCFELPDSFLEVGRVSGPVYIFSAPGLIFDSSKGVGSRLHIFARPNSFFGCTEGAGSRFQVLRSRTSFRRYRERRIPFSCFALPTSFSAVTMASAPDFIF